MADTPRWKAPLLAFVALVLVAMLGAGAIALERPVGAASGRVLSAETGKPIANARVTLTGPVTRTLLTAADGSYYFHRLPIGGYHAAARERTHDPQWHDGEVKVAEGQVAERIEFQLSRTVPALEVANVQRVFLPDEPVRLYLRGTQISDTGIDLYKLDLDRALTNVGDLDTLRRPPVSQFIRQGVLSPVKDWRQGIRQPEGTDDNWFHQAVQMPSLTPGAYMAVFNGNAEPEDGKPTPRTLERSYWFTVSDTALVTKRAEDAMLVYAVDMKTKRPLPGTSLKVLGETGTLAAGKTDRQGLARFPLSTAGQLVVTGHSGMSPAVARSWYYGESSPYRLYAYTERPVYRPGQRVHFKGLARAERQARYASAAGQTVRLVARDAKGVILQDTRHAVNGQSAFDGALELAEEAPLGEYTLEFSIGEASYEQVSFKVSDYRKPEFKVDVTTAKPRYVMGETAEAALEARYYFGAPVPGAKLLVTVYSAPHYGARDPELGFYDGFTAEAGIEPFWGYGDVVQQAEAVADAEGRYRLKLPLDRPTEADGWQGDRVYTIAVEGMDASRRPVKSTQSFVVTQGAFHLSVEPGQAIYAGRDAIDVGISARDYDDRPVQTTVELELVRLDYVEKKNDEGDLSYETERHSVYRGTVKTDAQGTARLSAPAMGPGSYEVLATARDTAGNRVLDTGWTWVAEPGAEVETARYGALQIVLDRKLYRPGQTARALVISPVPDVSALLTIEGVKLHSAQVVTLKGGSALVELPVTEAHQPNAFVAAIAVSGKELLTAERSLNVMPEEKFLRVTVASDKPRYQPGETARYTVTTRDWQGRPVAADVSLGVVDQAIYAIEPEKTSDIRAYFHGPRWNSVRTAHSFAEDYSGGLDKFAPDPRVRARLEDTAAWFPSLRTGTSGRATVAVTLPDNLTTWVATARAATLDTRVGSARHTMIATKDLLVRLDTPRFAVAGDRFDLAATVHNYTQAMQRVLLSLDVTGLQRDGDAARTIELSPGDARRELWSVRAEAAGPADATAMAKGQTDADALKLSFQTLPFGKERFTAIAGTAGAGGGTHVVELPRDSVPGTASLLVALHTSPLPVIHQAVDYLHTYEYGCVEQTMSRFMPDVALPWRLRAAGAPSGDRFADQEPRIADGVRRLVSMQQGDGGWGWWTHDESKVELTSYVLYGLAEARTALTPSGAPVARVGGADVPGAPVRRAIDFLQRALPKIDRDLASRHVIEKDKGPDARAFALFALARWDAAPDREVARLYAQREQLSAYGLAQFALALPPGERRREVLDRLERAAIVTESLAHWEPDVPDYAWQDDSVEATAYALRALLAERPDAALVAKAVRWLETQNERGRWNSTKDTAAAAIALAESLRVRQGEAPGGYTAVVRVNGAEVGRFTPSPSDPWAAPEPFRVSQGLRPGRNDVSVTLEGPGRLDYAGGLTFFQGGDRIAEASAHGLSVSRDYFLLSAERLAAVEGEPWKLYDEKVVADLTPVGGRVKAGERVLVRLTVRNTQALRYMAFEDPLPAGCEVLDPPANQWGYWWDHQEFRDEKAAFFASRLPAGTHTVYYVMRPTIRGAFRALPASAWGMYAQELRANTAERSLEITE